MAAAMLSRQVGLLAAAALVALMCAVAVAQQGPAPAFSSSPECKIVDKDVVKACFKSLGEGRKICMADRVISGQTTQVQVDCCVAFGGHQCLCQMKKAWKAQGNGAQNNVQCVREKAC